MATASTSNCREYLFRLQTLIIDGGSDALRNIFDQNLNNVPLDVFLANEKKVIYRLQGRGIITKAQYDLLFPPRGQPPNSANFDITLIICLLRNIQSFRLDPNYSWNSTPQPGDIKFEDDLCRLKGFRNEIAHISSTIGFNQASFLTKWTDIEQVLRRLNFAVPNPVPDLKQILDSYKHSALEPAAEQRIQADIENWRQLEKALEVEMKLTKEDVKGLRIDVNDVSKDVKDMKEGLEKVNYDIAEVKGSVGKMTESIRSLEEKDVNETKPKEANTQDSRHRKKTGTFQRIVKFVFPPRRQKGQKDFQVDLISFYRDQHGAISLSPLLRKDAPLLEFYVMPDIYSVQRTFSGDKKEMTAVTSLRNVFYNDDEMCRKIYLTADAGIGKTAFSKRLTLTWCQAKKPLPHEGLHFLQEEIKAVNEFDFVFLLLLRNSSSECDIDDLIWNQIILQLAHDYTREDLVNILCTERCLVILDGLDEWTHPLNSCKQGSSSIPHRKVRERTAVLTTTRPWKLSVSDLKSSQIDQTLELVGLNNNKAHALKKSVISHMSNSNNEYKLLHEVEAFTRAVKERRISDLETIPLLLMYLLFLWCNKIELGNSKSDLYSQITELLLSRTMQNYKSLIPNVDLPKGAMPQCFSGKKHCAHFYTLLTALGQLAYETLFREIREETSLVFDGSVAELHLKKDYFNFCLTTGLLTQSNVSVPGTLLEHKSKVSFAHKTVQEFFAALYIYMHFTSDQTSEIVLSKCKCIKDILEMSNILKFSSGMNVNVSSLISREMMKIINEDEITLKYRSTSDLYSNELKEFQDMCISCLKEIPRENDVSLCLQDVFIGESCQQEQYCENLKQLTSRNKQNIRSLYIDMYHMRHALFGSVQEVIEYFALSDLENIEKIHYNGVYNDRDILPLLSKSVKSLYLSSSTRDSWSSLLCEKVKSLQKLEAIYIIAFEISCSELTLLYDYISKRRCMRQIQLEELFCPDHEWRSCNGHSLDLSQHSQLNKLTLWSIPVSELNINMASLVKCHLQWLSNPDLALRFINCVPADSKLNTFACIGINSPVAIVTMLETLRLSVHVKHVELVGINVGNREIFTSEMVNIEHVKLWSVTMTASVLQGIVDVVQQQPQTVTVFIVGCGINPEHEFVTVKQKIKTSREHFRVLKDIDGLFKFETIKQGD